MRPQRGLRADVDEIERLCADLVAGVYRADDPPRARLQPRQLPPHASPAGRGRSVVADQPAGEGGEDRGQGDRQRPLRDLPDGEVAVPRELFSRILYRIARLRPPGPAPC